MSLSGNNFNSYCVIYQALFSSVTVIKNAQMVAVHHHGSQNERNKENPQLICNEHVTQEEINLVLGH